jgi:hypothetical protein
VVAVAALSVVVAVAVRRRKLLPRICPLALIL